MKKKIDGVKVACYDVGNLMDGRVRVRPSGGSVWGLQRQMEEELSLVFCGGGGRVHLSAHDDGPIP